MSCVLQHSGVVSWPLSPRQSISVQPGKQSTVFPVVGGCVDAALAVGVFAGGVWIVAGGSVAPVPRESGRSPNVVPPPANEGPPAPVVPGNGGSVSGGSGAAAVV